MSKSPKDILREICRGPQSIGSLVRSHVVELLSVIRGPSRWSIRSCIDDAEKLSSHQIRVLNSLVKKSTSDLTYVVAFARVPDIAGETADDPIALSEHDVRTLRLDWLDERSSEYLRCAHRFHELAVAVVDQRIAHWSRRHDGLEMDLGSERTDSNLRDVVLQAFSVDQRLDFHLASSDLAGPAEVYSRALGVGGASAASAGPSSEPDEDAVVEYEFPSLAAGQSRVPPDGGSVMSYQHYVESTLTLTALDRKDRSAQIRKRMFAAYLRICRSLDWTPLYGGWNEVLHLSDLCVRDLIWNMHELWEASDPPTAQHFVSRPIPLGVQSLALTKASDKKLTFARKYFSVSPSATLRLVDLLARMSYELQSDPRDPRSLSTPERGSFKIRVPHQSDPSLELMVLLEDAVRAGYLRLVKRSTEEWELRVHRGRAPKYGFSHRRPQYSVRLDPDALLMAARERDPLSVQKIRNLVPSWSGQTSLFDSDGA